MCLTPPLVFGPDFAHIIQQTVGGAGEVEYLDAMEDDPQKRKPDIRKAKELLNWEPKVCVVLSWGGNRAGGRLDWIG